MLMLVVLHLQPILVIGFLFIHLHLLLVVVVDFRTAAHSLLATNLCFV